MDLIARYLQAVRFWLPKQQQDDIIAELSQDVNAQIEEHEERLGRKLNELEVETLLRQRGSPIMVANKYLPQRSLIGPLLFPIYLFVLKVVTACMLIPAAVGLIAGLISGPLTHAVKGGWEPPFAHIGSQLWSAWFSAMAVVTLIFAILERTHAKAELLEKWDPRKLPPLRPKHMIPRTNSAIEVAVNLCVLVWWGWNMAAPLELHLGNVHVMLTAEWVWFFWGILLLTLASTVVAAVNFMRPYWTPARVAMRLCLDAAGAVFFCSVLKANLLATIDWPSATPNDQVIVVSQVNLWLGRMFPFAIFICLLIVSINAWRLVSIVRKSGIGAPRTPSSAARSSSSEKGCGSITCKCSLPLERPASSSRNSRTRTP